MRWRFGAQQPVRSGFHAISSDGTEIEVDCDKMVRQLRNALHQGGTETSVSDHDARLFLSRHHWDVESALKEAEDACAHNLMKAKRMEVMQRKKRSPLLLRRGELENNLHNVVNFSRI